MRSVNILVRLIYMYISARTSNVMYDPSVTFDSC
jgi:hypothetical protein